jgi:hypothetical protein
VSGLSDHEGTLFAFMIGREDIGLTAALPRVASHAPVLRQRGNPHPLNIFSRGLLRRRPVTPD